jgi:hypothetical protein|tara:strand:- start:14223 stop:14738 length:516 start_codon:yes stop_codon:yes gene_type:complete
MQALPAAEQPASSNLDGFATFASAPWSLHGFPSVPSAHQPLMPNGFEFGPLLNIPSEAGWSDAFVQDNYQPLVPVFPMPEAQFDFTPQQEPSQAILSTQAAIINPAQATREERHTCPKGCNKTFRRGGDYRRHMKKHELHPFKCCIMNCGKTFYRPDKLRDHLKQGHKFTL